jgi:hypothetical protein
MLLGVQVDDFPTEPSQLIQQRLLDVVAFVEADLFGGILGAHDGMS